MNGQINFLPYYQRYFLKRKIEKYIKDTYGEKSGYKIVFPNITYSTSCPITKTILLPPLANISLNTLKILAEHEADHIRMRGEFLYDYDYLKRYPMLNVAELVMHIIEDNVINKGLMKDGHSKGSICKVMDEFGFKGLSYLSLIDDKEERLKIIKNYIKSGLFKKDAKAEEIDKLIETLVRKLKRNTREAITSEEFKRLYKLINVKSKVDSDGAHNPTCGAKYHLKSHGISYDSGRRLPDFKYVQKIRQIIRRLKVIREEEKENTQFYGKKLNRAYIHSDTEYKPFINKMHKVSISNPKILVLVDFSGSMVGEHEKIAKTFTVAIMQEFSNSVVITSQYHGNPLIKVVNTTNELINMYATGDEGFDSLEWFFNENRELLSNAEMFVLISDLVIDSSELKGLLNTVGKLRIPKMVGWTIYKDEDDETKYVIKKLKSNKFKIYRITEMHDTVELAKRMLNLYK